MSSADVIDALFDRTVDIVQSLPKSGPIQTSYEEKLALYSLYKQATEGDVTSKRPGMLDMLGRAKWDAWAQRQGLSPLDAKQLYVESMMRTLRKFADRPQARELIEELEAFSGDVAERVMRGALETDDTSSEASSAPAPLRHRPPRPSSDDDERDDRLSSLRQTGQPQRRPGPPQQRYSHPSSVEGASSTMAHHDARSRMSIGSSTPQRRGSETSEDEADVRYTSQIPSSSSMRGPSITHHSQPQHRQQAPPGAGSSRFGPPGPPSSVGAGARAPPQRGANQGLYSGGGRFGQGPPPPRSESNAGGFGGAPTGGAGASLYSAVGPSSRPVEHHYYHSSGAPGAARAPSSVGGRSNPGRPGPVANNREIDQALQSIQASLAGLHERLNRVETGAGPHRSPGGGVGGGALRSAYRAVLNAAHDIGVLVGLASPGRSGSVAPTFGATSSTNAAGSNRPSLLRAPLTFILALINLALRLTLDLTSLGILLTLLLFIFKRITGRGDPLLLLRMAQRLLSRRGRGAEKLAIVGASAAAAAVVGAASGVTGQEGGPSGRGTGGGSTSRT